MPTCRAFTAVALLCATFAATACGAFSSDSPPPAAVPAPGDVKAPPITGTPDQGQLTEEFGIFVAPGGADANGGTREHPLGTIQAGIALGKQNGKRVYVCSGTFREAIVLADSISIVGGLDCGSRERWSLGGPRTRIEAPTSPAVRAKDIASSTRLEGLDIVAPNVKEPSASSIGLLADHAGGLVIANSKISAGDGANGADGTEGIQLTKDILTYPGVGSSVAEQCIDPLTCAKSPVAAVYPWLKPIGSPGGKGICNGAPGHNGLSGGNGGSGGLWVPVQVGPQFVWNYYANNSPSMAPELGQDRPRTAAAVGTSGTPAAALGTFSAEGYVAANGVAGTDGAPGNGGFGGRGSDNGLPTASMTPYDQVWHGTSGPGGGAGGCPGLAGTAGAGAGASIALASVDSPLVVDGSELVAGRAGAGGHGTFGSDPTTGGAAGINGSSDPLNAARPGLNGGAPGISTSGSNGPSVGILHSGAAPILRSGAKVTPGPAAPAIDARSHTDALGNTRTIPATPAGISKDIIAL